MLIEVLVAMAPPEQRTGRQSGNPYHTQLCRHAVVDTETGELMAMTESSQFCEAHAKEGECRKRQVKVKYDARGAVLAATGDEEQISVGEAHTLVPFLVPPVKNQTASK